MESLKTYITSEVVLGPRYRILKFIRTLGTYGNQHAIYLLRLFQVTSNKKGIINGIIAHLTKNRLIKIYGIELSKRTKIDLGLKIGHANGIIIGEGVEIGKNVTIYHQVTIGLSSVDNKGEYELYPSIGDNCIIYSGAKIFGNIRLAEGTVVGANSVLTTDTEPNSVYAGVPARRIR